MEQWLIIFAGASLLGVVCARWFVSRRSLFVVLSLWWGGVAAWLFMSPPGDLWWPIPLFWIGCVGSAVIALVRFAARRAA
jgi:hypothetical protein